MRLVTVALLLVVVAVGAVGVYRAESTNTASCRAVVAQSISAPPGTLVAAITAKGGVNSAGRPCTPAAKG